MESEVCENDSDSDSLPEISELFPPPSKEIKKGDIVWAKFKKLYWPALVRCVYQKEKKLTVWYTDDPGKNFKLLLKNVFSFHDSEMSAKIKKEVSQHGASVIEAHDGLTFHAMTYLSRKAEGLNDDPLKFFDQTYPYFTMEEWLKQNPTADREMYRGMKITPLYLDHSFNTTTIRKRGSALKTQMSDDDSDIVPEESDESDEDLPTNNGKNTDNAKNTNKIAVDSCENEYINSIVNCITSGKADTFLSNVVSKKVSSDYYKFYLKAMKSDKRDLYYVSYGPIEDTNLLRVIIIYLLDMYNNISSKGKKRKTNTVTYCSTDNKIEHARFVSSVMLPESIIFAISCINNVSLDEAKKLFHKKSVIKPEVDQNFLESLNGTSCENTSRNEESYENAPSSSSGYGSLESDANLAGCSIKRSHCTLDDVLKGIDTDEYSKCSLSSSPTVAATKTRRKAPKRRKSRKRY